MSTGDDKKDADEEYDPEFELFVKEKSEIFILVFCIMLHNLDCFSYIWNNISYLWNDLHLSLLLNYLFDS
jgi:hypothetical protein